MYMCILAMSIHLEMFRRSGVGLFSDPLVGGWDEHSRPLAASPVPRHPEGPFRHGSVRRGQGLGGRARGRDHPPVGAPINGPLFSSEKSRRSVGLFRGPWKGAGKNGAGKKNKKSPWKGGLGRTFTTPRHPPPPPTPVGAVSKRACLPRAGVGGKGKGA